MLLIYVNGNLIENMIIYKNELLFSDTDEQDNLFYTKRPVNEYVKGTDKYLEVEAILYDILEFKDTNNIKIFKDLCLLEHNKGIDSFTFEDLKIYLEEIEDDSTIKIID